MSTNNSMEELSVGQLMEKYNLIVPEIQREYVWGNNEYKILDAFIQDIKEGFLNKNNLVHDKNHKNLIINNMC